MINAIYLDKNQVPAVLRQGYTGNKFQVVVTESIKIPADAGLWSGGSRDFYTVVELSSGNKAAAPNQHLDPWTSARQSRTVELKDNYAVIEHSIFQGKDMGLTIYVAPANAAGFLPAPVELTDDQRLVLTATREFKSSYNGQDRFAMANDRRRWKNEPLVTRERWEAAKAELIASGFLNKAGAITTKGKNAAQ